MITFEQSKKTSYVIIWDSSAYSKEFAGKMFPFVNHFEDF